MTDHDENQMEIRIPVEWESSESLPTIYANQLFVTHAGQQVYLVFGELPIVMVSKPGDPIPEKLDIRPVARIAISKESMVAFVQALQTNLKHLLEGQSHLLQEDEGES